MSSNNSEDTSVNSNYSTFRIVETSNDSLTDVPMTSKSINLQPTSLPKWVYIKNPPDIDCPDAIDNSTLTPLPTFKNLGNNIFPITKAIPTTSAQSILVKRPTIKAQQILIQNPNTLQTVPIPVASKKSLGTYVRMIKTTKPIALTSLPNPKFVIASMPKSKRITNGSTILPKLAIRALETHKPLVNKSNTFNFKISDGKIITGSTSILNTTNINNKDLNNPFTFASISNIASSDINGATSESSDANKVCKHGISILKKNLFIETKNEKNHSNIVSNSIASISDTNPEPPIPTTSSTTTSNEEPTISIITAPQQKSERRRKSAFAYRKDFDEMVFSEGITEKEKNDNKLYEAEKLKLAMDIANIKPDINMNNNLSDINELLAWENGIGSLPGSDIKFSYNKYSFLQILTKEEVIQLTNKRLAKAKLKLDDMCCLHCGCYGLPSEFISPKYCSYDCRDRGTKVEKLKERNLRLRAYNYFKKTKDLSGSDTPTSENKTDKERSDTQISNGSDDDENSQDKFTLPWVCAKKGFSWPKYLDHVKAKGAPVKLFKDPFPYNRNGFKPGMKLEGIDPQHASYFCVLTVVEVIGYRVRLHFDGYSDNYDFWVNADSMEIFPAGWCEKYGHELHPPPSYNNAEFSWSTYIRGTRSVLAPKHLFVVRGTNAIYPNGFRIGMKLEAVDRKNSSLVCVATIKDMMDNRLLVHFDSWDEIYDYWVDPSSPYIHPVGWADKNGHSLTPPHDYKNPETFNWEKYLKDNKFVAAPTRAFKQRPSCGFKKGMRLECVDKRVPRLIRVATVDDVKEQQIRISFDGWPDRYSYWIDCDSKNLHPVGWCQKTGHIIEPPLIPADVYDISECPTIGCRGHGHIEGAKYPAHSSIFECPYSDENYHKENVLKDRLLSPDRHVETVEPVSREPKDTNKKMLKTKPMIKSEFNYYDEIDEYIDIIPLKKIKTEPDEKNDEMGLPLTNGYANDDVEELWHKHTKFLDDHIKDISNPNLWEKRNVMQFISSIPDCKEYGSLFEEQEIDGPAFLMLNQEDLINVLNIKVGPAIKLYSIIVLLRRRSLC